MHLCLNSEILSLKPLASKGWDQNTTPQVWPINRGWGNVKMYTKTSIAFVYTLSSLFSKFLLPKKVSIEFSKRCHFNSNQCCRHIIFGLSKHLTTIWNIRIMKFICHLKPWCSCHTRRSSRPFQFIPSISTHSIRSSEVVPIITTHL